MNLKAIPDQREGTPYHSFPLVKTKVFSLFGMKERMMNDDLRLRNQTPYMKTTIFWFVLVVILVSGVSWISLALKPAWLGFERKAYVASHQYIEGHRTAVARYVAQCKPLPEGPQKQELRQRIAAEKALIPTDARYSLGEC